MVPFNAIVILFSECRHVAIKLFIHFKSMRSELDTEFNVYRRIESASKHYLGRTTVRSLLDLFDVDRLTGLHRCLVY